jgi:DNA-binding TFAR19-related protein (PDSD5 family)
MDGAEEDQYEQMAQQVMALEKIAKPMMSKESISRYGNLKAAHPETAIKAIAIVAQAVQMGQLRQQLSDPEFKEILIEIQKGKRTYKFKA